MCLAIPMKIKKIEKEFAVVECGGLKRKVNIQMVAHLKPGDFVMVHAGFAIEKLNPDEAKETLTILDEIR